MSHYYRLIITRKAVRGENVIYEEKTFPLINRARAYVRKHYPIAYANKTCTQYVESSPKMREPHYLSYICYLVGDNGNGLRENYYVNFYKSL